MGMTYKAKLEKAKMRNITIPSEILGKDIVGVYKFFAILEDEKVCFYIGKSTNIRERLLSSSVASRAPAHADVGCRPAG